MKKVSAIAWSSNGKKLAIASADKVSTPSFRLYICLMMLERRRINSRPNHRIKDKNLISYEHLSFHLTQPKSLLLKVTILSSFTKSVLNGERKKQSATSSQFPPQSPV